MILNPFGIRQVATWVCGRASAAGWWPKHHRDNWRTSIGSAGLLWPLPSSVFGWVAACASTTLWRRANDHCHLAFDRDLKFDYRNRTSVLSWSSSQNAGNCRAEMRDDEKKHCHENDFN